MSENNITLPLIPLRGITIFPNMVIHFDVGRKKSIGALEVAMANKSEIFLSAQKDINVEDPTIDEIQSIGTFCNIKQILKLPNNVTRVLVEGIKRGKILSVKDESEYMEAEVEHLDNLPITSDDIDGYVKMLKKSFSKYVKVSEGIKSDALNIFKDIENHGELADIIASYVILDDEKKQDILEELDVVVRIEKLLSIIENEIKLIQVEKKISNRLKENIDKSQKEYYLREQIKIIQEELGEDPQGKSEVDKIEDKIKKSKLPKYVKEKAKSELDRLKYSSGHGAENEGIISYLNWILDIPWNKSTDDSFDIKNAYKVLEGEHYGLDDVKERIVEYLAVKEYTKSLKGPILCLVGPPGVGKTSIAKSISKAIGRRFVRMSLGGVKDEAEIRGHRRTYIGAIPGRIAYSLKEAKSNNPLILLDEIDKLGYSQRGNTADALLEVLDSEQNNSFRDHYLELDINLSNVMFITTANSLDGIPSPLLDRMEVIEVSGYTYEEKYHIAKKYLIPKLLKEHKLTSEDFKISDAAIVDLINYYTCESGVRSLERVLGKLVRKVLTEMLNKNKKRTVVTANRLEKYLGAKVYSFDKKDNEDKVGVVKGMAWTSVGGDTLPVEVITMKGTGKLQLTGQLGDVMQESAKIAMGYVRANSISFGIEEDFYKNKDIHIHFPEGAIKKDGPSAGVTITTALVSSLTNKKVRSNVAMTGEVTLTGRVMPIGGLKEKSIAAFRAGIDTIIIPKANEKDLIKIPTSIKNKLEIITVEDVREVLNKAIIGVDTIDEN